MRSSPTPAAPHWEPRTWALLAVLCGVLFLDGLDVSMVGMALPSIRDELGLTTSQLQWVVSGYVLGYGGLLLLGGRAADLLGRRRVLIVGLSVFVVASAVGGLVNDGTLLVVTRVLKGMSAAFTAPAGLSIITTTFSEGPNRNRALAYYTATGASGFSLGLVFGGLLTELGWRWTFLLPVPFALAILLLAPRVIPRDRLIPGAKHRYDVAGAVTITAAMMLLVRTVVDAPATGWGDPVIVGVVRARARAVDAVRCDRVAHAAAAGPARHPAQRLARAREHRHGRDGRRLHRVPVRRHALPAGRCTAGRRSRRRWPSSRVACWSRSARRASVRS